MAPRRSTTIACASVVLIAIISALIVDVAVSQRVATITTWPMDCSYGVNDIRPYPDPPASPNMCVQTGTGGSFMYKCNNYTGFEKIEYWNPTCNGKYATKTISPINRCLRIGLQSHAYTCGFTGLRETIPSRPPMPVPADGPVLDGWRCLNDYCPPGQPYIADYPLANCQGYNKSHLIHAGMRVGPCYLYGGRGSYNVQATCTTGPNGLLTIKKYDADCRPLAQPVQETSYPTGICMNTPDGKSRKVFCGN